MPTTPAIPENAPFTAAQRTWLNGFLAGLFARKESEEGSGQSQTSARPQLPLRILFGSQTGTAEGLARRLAAQASESGFKTRVSEANGAAKLDWTGEQRLLVITSTYGDGDMPDNAQGFWDWLQTDEASVLRSLEFGVLALGDSSYEHFCAAGKKIDERLEQLGARRIHPRTDCDTDYEATAKDWMQGVLSSLKSASTSLVSAKPSPVHEASEPAAEAVPEVEPFSRNNPYPATLLVNRLLTGEGSNKEIRHFEIALEGSGLVYEAGDALGVQASNCPALVDELLEALHCDGEEAVTSPRGGEVSLRKALSNHCDITKPGQELLRLVSEKNEVLRALMAPQKKADLKRWLWGREVIDLLFETPGLEIAPAEFVKLLKPLNPRLYSISSSPRFHSGQVHLTVSIVRHTSHGRVRKGVCSTFLADRVSGRVPVPVFIQPAHGFKLPASGETPIIMIGPGTGVAPFRAFLHERQAAGSKGRNWLFFGEQHASSDFYYREELEPMVRSGHLTRLSTAFSRDQTDKIYVQHRMLEEAAELWSWLEAGAHFYVCGDASRMAKDVDAALHRVIETAGGKTPEQAAEYLNTLKREHRYQRDVY
jgi:sulfite reductase (NADPH) flavoprotein alpha-component